MLGLSPPAMAASSPRSSVGRSDLMPIGPAGPGGGLLFPVPPSRPAVAAPATPARNVRRFKFKALIVSYLSIPCPNRPLPRQQDSSVFKLAARFLSMNSQRCVAKRAHEDQA